MQCYLYEMGYLAQEEEEVESGHLHLHKAALMSSASNAGFFA